MKYFFEAERKDEVLAASLEAKNLTEATRLFQAFIAGYNEGASYGASQTAFQLTSATAYKRRGVTYREVEL